MYKIQQIFRKIIKVEGEGLEPVHGYPIFRIGRRRGKVEKKLIAFPIEIGADFSNENLITRQIDAIKNNCMMKQIKMPMSFRK